MTTQKNLNPEPAYTIETAKPRFSVVIEAHGTFGGLEAEDVQSGRILGMAKKVLIFDNLTGVCYCEIVSMNAEEKAAEIAVFLNTNVERLTCPTIPTTGKESIEHEGGSIPQKP